MQEKKPRFYYRYNQAFILALKKIEERLSQFSKSNNVNIKDKREIAILIVDLYEKSWCVMHDLLLYKGKTILLPRKVLKEYLKNEDYQNWLQFINDRILACSGESTNYDLLIRGYIKIYQKMFYKFKDDVQKDINLCYEDFLKHDILDTELKLELDLYTQRLLSNFFKNNNSIEKVWIYGSRVEGTSRKYSDIDLIIKGEFSDNEYNNILQALEKLNLPYIFDIHNYQEVDSGELRRRFINRNIEHGILLYKRM